MPLKSEAEAAYMAELDSMAEEIGGLLYGTRAVPRVSAATMGARTAVSWKLDDDERYACARELVASLEVFMNCVRNAVRADHVHAAREELVVAIVRILSALDSE
jgi:hypothetical protein